jgi:hypothetical protein
MATRKTAGNVTAPDLVPLATALVDAVGEAQAAATLKIDRSTLARVLGGLSIRRGTAVQLRAAFAEPGAPGASTVTPDAAALVPILKAYVRLHGPVRAAASLGIDRGTLARCAGGRRIHTGTAVQVSIALAALHSPGTVPEESETADA